MKYCLRDKAIIYLTVAVGFLLSANLSFAQTTTQNNWRGASTGPYHATLNPQGQGNRVSNNVDFIPWLGYDPTTPIPTISELNQYKSDGQTEIGEGGITTESNDYDSQNGVVLSTVVFKAAVSDTSGSNVKLEVELKETGQEFNGTETLLSDVVPSGTTASITRHYLVNGTYHWRARAVNVNGTISDWQEFGTIGNTDFTVKLVPLYTQIESEYPSRDETERWAIKNYGSGYYSDCLEKDPNTGELRSTIRRCGCAITSMVMLGRYYGISNGTNNSEVNPLEMNAWLTDNNGYSYWGKNKQIFIDNGNLNWGKAQEYLGVTDNGVKKTYLHFDLYNASPAVPLELESIDNHINSAKPAVAYSKTFGHYIILDGKIKDKSNYNIDTYTIKDSVWYNTETLNETKNIANHVQGYNNRFFGANLFTYMSMPEKIARIAYLYLASPAEYLVIDPMGRRLGFNPVTNTRYEEIPNGRYTIEGTIASSEEILYQSAHQLRVIYIPELMDGKYDIQVIGTDTGKYIVSSLIYDDNGNSHASGFKGYIISNASQHYTLDYYGQANQPIVFDRIISVQTIKDEIEAARNLNLIDNNGVKNSLIVKLENAQKQISANKKSVAISALNAFINEVNAQSGKHIIKDMADLFIDDAQSLIENFNPHVSAGKIESSIFTKFSNLLADIYSSVSNFFSR